VAALKKATPAEISELPGVGPKLAAAIHAHLTSG
jgi:excinuclease ABC subunit C